MNSGESSRVASVLSRVESRRQEVKIHHFHRFIVLVYVIQGEKIAPKTFLSVTIN